MRGNNFSLSYRAGFNIAKGVHFYLLPRPAWLYRFAERNNIGNRWMKVCKICFAILVIFFIAATISYIADDGFCILHGYIYLPDEEFDDVLTIAAICGIVTGLASAFAVFRDNGFRLELDDMNENEGEAGGL